MRRLATWILKRIGRVSIYGSRRFPNRIDFDTPTELRSPVGDVTYVQRGDDGKEEDEELPPM